MITEHKYFFSQINLSTYHEGTYTEVVSIIFKYSNKKVLSCSHPITVNDFNLLLL